MRNSSVAIRGVVLLLLPIAPTIIRWWHVKFVRPIALYMYVTFLSLFSLFSLSCLWSSVFSSLTSSYAIPLPKVDCLMTTRRPVYVCSLLSFLYLSSFILKTSSPSFGHAPRCCDHSASFLTCFLHHSTTITSTSTMHRSQYDRPAIVLHAVFPSSLSHPSLNHHHYLLFASFTAPLYTCSSLRVIPRLFASFSLLFLLL